MERLDDKKENILKIILMNLTNAWDLIRRYEKVNKLHELKTYESQQTG